MRYSVRSRRQALVVTNNGSLGIVDEHCVFALPIRTLIVRRISSVVKGKPEALFSSHCMLLIFTSDMQVPSWLHGWKST